MVRRTLLIVLLVGTALLAGAVSPVSGEYPEPFAVCDSVDQQSLVLAFADGRTVAPGTNVSVYPGTEFKIYLCTDNDIELAGTAWQLSSVDGVTQEDQTDYAYVLRARAASQQTSIELRNKVEGKGSVRAPGLTIFPGYVATTGVDSSIQVRFTSEERFSNYTRQEDTYGNSAARIQSVVTELEQTNRSEVTHNWTTSMDDRLEELNESTGSLNRSHRKIERLLFGVAADGRPGAPRALTAYQTNRSEVLEASRSAVTNQTETLSAAAHSSARWTLVNFLASIVLGCLIGGGGGWYFTKRKLSDVEYLRSRTSAVDFDPRQIGVPLAVAGLLFLGATAILFLSIGLSNILAVLQSLL
jgi:hypothetical protein